MAEQQKEQAIAQFRHRVEGAATTYEQDFYRAFKAVDRRQKRLLIVPIGSSSEWVNYQYLLRIVLEPRETKLALIFSFMVVTFTGNNLSHIAQAIADEHCESVHGYDSKRWNEPPKNGEPVIDMIDFVTDRPPNGSTYPD